MLRDQRGKPRRGSAFSISGDSAFEARRRMVLGYSCSFCLLTLIGAYALLRNARR